MPKLRGLVLLAAVSLACGTVRGDDAFATAAGDAAGGTTTGTEPGTTAGGTSGSPSADSTGGDSTSEPEVEETGEIKFDTPGGDDGTNGIGCQKIDFLFVVDNSGSMADEQQNLVSSFPDFFDTIAATLEADDFHIMVVTTDGDSFTTTGTGTNIVCSNGNCSCSPTPDCCETACGLSGSETCFGVPCSQQEELEDCDGQRGAGRRFSQDESCGFENAGRYVTGADQNLAAALACASDVGTFGSGNEVPMDAMLKATAPEINAAAGCNEGFLRDDAVLVVTFITDEEDDHENLSGIDFGSPGTPQAWHDEIVANKNGLEDGVVVLGLFGDGDQADGVCGPYDGNAGTGAEPAPRLREFVESFGDRGIVGSVCAPSYNEFFVDAVATIDTTCDEFEPEG
ncbi:MAG: hypothetical protein AAF721_33455 [Myxococcota bacterium]